MVAQTCLEACGVRQTRAVLGDFDSANHMDGFAYKQCEIHSMEYSQALSGNRSAAAGQGLPMSQWNSEAECRANPEFRLGPDPSLMVLDDTLANRKTDTGPRILPPMETHEHVEDSLCIAN